MVSPARWRRAAAATAAAAGALGALSCADSPGEIMLVVQTDMALPKDIDAVRIEIRAEGEVRFDETFPNLGGQGILLPASLGVVGRDGDPSVSVGLRVSGRSQGRVRVLREVITQVPPDRVSYMSMPLQFLCVGSAAPELDGEGQEVSLCPEGMTCDAGVCVPREVPPESLPDYNAAEVYGGGAAPGAGSCFDVTGCFAEGAAAAIDPSDCSIDAPPGDFNIALLTGGPGMATALGSLVALDAEAAPRERLAGWARREDGRVQLPQAACAPLFPEAQVIGAALAAARDGCPTKTTSSPTCGPWWNREPATPPPPPPGGPVSEVEGQASPVDLALGGDGALYWVTSGLAAEPSALRMRSPSGQVSEIYQTPLSVRQVAVSGRRVYFTVGGSVAGTTEVNEGVWFEDLDDATPPAPIAMAGDGCEGIAVTGNFLATTFTNLQALAYGDLLADGRSFGIIDNLPLGAPVTRAALRQTDVALETPMCVALDAGGGFDPRLLCYPVGIAGTAVEQPQAARIVGVAISTADIVWASEDGVIRRVPLDENAAGSTPVELATGQADPGGIAADDLHVYWTARGEGAVRRTRLDSSGEVETLASGEARPGDIVVGADRIYWVSEGDPSLPTGAIRSLPKPP